MTLAIAKLADTHYQQAISWDERDAIIYAMATGHTYDGIDDQNLSFVYEKNLTVIPAFATSLARNAMPTLGDLGGDYTKVVLAGTEAHFFQALPAAGTAQASTQVLAVVDKGIAKGAIITLETRLWAADTTYALIVTQIMARGDGGCGNYLRPKSLTITRAVKPQCAPQQKRPLGTRPDQAALYRLLGDHNPLHIDPVAAQAAGFPRPILHGLCSYGIAYQGVSRLINGDISGFNLRFSAPIFPGEPLELQLWQEGKHYYFELLAPLRHNGVTVSGLATVN